MILCRAHFHSSYGTFSLIHSDSRMLTSQCCNITCYSHTFSKMMPRTGSMEGREKAWNGYWNVHPVNASKLDGDAIAAALTVATATTTCRGDKISSCGRFAEQLCLALLITMKLAESIENNRFSALHKSHYFKMFAVWLIDNWGILVSILYGFCKCWKWRESFMEHNQMAPNKATTAATTTMRTVATHRIGDVLCLFLSLHLSNMYVYRI